MNRKAYRLVAACCLAVALAACEEIKTGEAAVIDPTPRHDYDIVEYQYFNRFSMDGPAMDAEYGRYAIYNTPGKLGGDSVYYPQIMNIGDESREKEINERLKTHAMRCLSLSSPEDTIITSRYNITLATNQLISISYEVISFHYQQAYPLIRNDTITIDIESGGRLKLSDIVNIDDSLKGDFFNRFVNITDYGFGDNMTEEDVLFLESVGEIVGDLVNKYNKLPECDGELYSDVPHSYLTDDSLVISFPIQKAAGSYVWYEAKFSDLEEWLLPVFRSKYLQ